MAFIYTRPRGTLARSMPDWRMDDMSIGSYGGPPTSGAVYQYVSLYNNDNLGRGLVVWSVQLSVDTFNFLLLYMYPGNRGIAVPSCMNINPTRALIAGQMYNDQAVAKYTDTPVYTGGTLIFTNFPSNLPMLIVPAGWSLAFGSDLNGAYTTLALWFLPTEGA